VASLVAAEPGEAQDGAQFPELGPLLLGDAQGFAVQFLSDVRMSLPQQQLAIVPIELPYGQATLRAPLSATGGLATLRGAASADSTRR
jgi:hypothetical protein